MDDPYHPIDFSVRDESADDVSAVFAVNRAAFEGPEEATLVDRLRTSAAPIVSLVAEIQGQVIGHILFSPVSVETGRGDKLCLGLGPMAVLPQFQNLGVGSELVERGLERCRVLGASAVFVLGHPDYYPRFGFKSAAPYGFRYKKERFDPFFFVIELEEGFSRSASGLVRYHPAFDSV